MKTILSSKRCHRVARIGIFLITVALIAGTVGCGEVTPPARYDLTISGTEGGSVTSPGEPGPYTYDEDEVVNLVAEAEEGYRFVNWTGDIGEIAHVEDPTTTITMQGNYEITASFEAILHSTYKLICDIPDVIVACEDTRVPVTLKTDELGELGYDGVQLHVRVYPRAGDVTIKLYFWSFSNELYSNEFDLPADYNRTIYPLVYFSEPGEYTVALSLIEAPYGPVIDDMMEYITVSVVEA